MIGVLALIALCYIIYYMIQASDGESHKEWQNRMDEKHDL